MFTMYVALIQVTNSLAIDYTVFWNAIAPFLSWLVARELCLVQFLLGGAVVGFGFFRLRRLRRLLLLTQKTLEILLTE